MSAFASTIDAWKREKGPLRILSASGQLGYGIPEPAFRAGIARKPHLIGADMGSVRADDLHVLPDLVRAGHRCTPAVGIRRRTGGPPEGSP